MDRRRARRALKDEEVRRLIAAAFASKTVIAKLSGPERALLYLAATYTGFRWGEHRDMKRKDFLLEEDPPRLAPPAEVQKSGRADVVVLRLDLAAVLRGYFTSRLLAPGDLAFPMPTNNEGGGMVESDLAETGDSPEVAAEKIARGEEPVKPIPYVDDHGRYADFHSLRHSLGTMLDKVRVDVPVPLGVRHQIMRHSPGKSLTLRVYTHTELVEQAEVLEKLPNLIPAGMLKGAVADDGYSPVAPILDARKPVA